MAPVLAKHGGRRAVGTALFLWLLLAMSGEANAARRKACIVAQEHVASQTTQSSRGVFSLQVTDLKRTVDGIPQYTSEIRLQRHGRPIWTKEVPYTVLHVTVTDDGQAVGVGHRSDPMPSGQSRLNYLHVFLFDVRGREVLNDVHRRVPLPHAYHPPQPARPHPRQLIVIPDADAFLVTVLCKEWSECWWVYRLSSGDVLRRRVVYQAKLGATTNSWVVQAVTVKGTPLVLVHWYDRVCSNEGCTVQQHGGRFSLVSLDGKELWSRRMRQDYDKMYEGPGRRDILEYLETHPGILPTAGTRTFELRSFANNRRILFEVTTNDDGDWIVAERSNREFLRRQDDTTSQN